MGTIKVEGNGNVVIQSHSGFGDNIAGNKIVINQRPSIADLIAKNRIDEAIAALPQTNDVLLLTSRWNGHKRNKMLGLLSFSDENVERSRIIAAIMSYAGEEMPLTTTSSTQSVQSTSWEDVLLRIEADNKRKNPSLANESAQILVLLRQYQDRKRISKIFDVNGTRYKEIEAELKAFVDRVNNNTLDSREAFVEKVAGLLDATIPGWDSIKEAFDLCVGRGMMSNHMENVIAKRPDDNEAKLRIVEAIEEFLSR